MKHHAVFTHNSTRERATPPTAGKRSKVPRHRMRGGDLPRGGAPASTGHAGRARLGSSMLAFVLATQCILVALAITPTRAYAATTIYFANGKSASLDADGTIRGTAHVGDWDDSLGERYPISMPDGAQIYGWCLDYLHAAPAPGNYPFVATPKGGGTYSVVVDSTGGSASPRQAPASVILYPPQRVGNFIWSPKINGKVKVQKGSVLVDMTDHNACYAFVGARYGIYKDEACTKAVAGADDLVVGQGGTSNEVTLSSGTYWIKEKEAPKGYLLDETAHKVVIQSNKSTSLPVWDKPKYEQPKVWATKYDIQHGGAQGAATFAGAEFTVRYYDGIYSEATLPDEATRTWVLKSDAEGRIVPSDASLVSGSAFYRNEQGEVVLPLGTVTVQETKAPSGYWLEGQTPDSAREYRAPVHIATVDGTGSYDSPRIAEGVRRAGIALKKVDAQTGDGPQGDASLAGITFALVNKNDQPVVVNERTYAPNETIPSVLTTDEQGAASTSADLLPVGTYEVVEESTNESMLNTAQRQTITITADATNTLVFLNKPMADSVVRGGVAVGKISRETGQHLTQGEASLAGAVFSVTLDSPNPVLVDGAWHATNEVVCTLTTDENGLAQTGERTLPYGTYTVREVQAPKGFNLNEEWSSTFQIRQDGVVVDLSGEGTSVDDQVMRGGFAFNKVDEDTMERMPFVAWLIESVTTGERHVIVADENGIVDTEAFAHSHNTNANDEALKDGAIDPEALDKEAGIWFSGRNDLTTEPQDDLSALPYDTYTVQELPSEANKEHGLVSFTVRIHRHNMHANMGTVDDKPLRIGTSLTSTSNTHMAPVASKIQLVDTIVYEGLETGKEYTLEGALYDAETREQLVDGDGIPVFSTTTFVATAQSGMTQVVFELNSTTLAGKTVVATERLLLQGEEVTTHDDLDDQAQTVHFPNIGTSLGAHDDQAIATGKNVELIDTVTYENLIPGLHYEVVGTLMSKQDKGPLINSDGGEVQSATTFVPSEPSGSIEVVFSFDESCARAKTLVAFETLKQADVTLVHHEDWEDQRQTIQLPSIRTELTDGEGNHTIAPTGTVELTDTVTYTGLEPGTSYALEGTLMDKATGEALVDGEGNPVRASTTFTPDEPSGTAPVVFAVDAALCAGRTIVAFESLSLDGRELCIHANLEDEAQTVYVPAISTTLTSKAGTNEVGSGHIVLVDRVRYQGLQANETYTMVGTLTNKESGKLVTNEDGSVVVATKTFKAEAADGTVDVTFEFDSNEVAGHSLVAFETLCEGESADGREIVRHADIDNVSQTVHAPLIATEATNAQTGEKTLPGNGTIRIRDTVTFEGLTPGAHYLMMGTLHDKETGDSLEKILGSKATATKTFVPKESSGRIEIEFIIDAQLVAGKEIVVFESCQREGVEIAAHADIRDKNQTVMVETKKDQESKGGTKAKTPSTGDSSTLLLAAAFAVLGASLLIARQLLK